jgi:two-component sensor histidine kinase
MQDLIFKRQFVWLLFIIELSSNSVEHAFNDKDDGNIYLDVTKRKTINLS